MNNWTDNRTVKFAVGCTLLLLLGWWLLTGDLLKVAEVATEQPVEGQTKSAAIWPVVQSVLIEAVILLGGSAIAFSIGIWNWLYGLIFNSSQQSQPPGLDAEPKPSSSSLEDIAHDLIRAIALGDAAEEAKYRPLVRIPYAQHQVLESLQAGDFEAARKLTGEIEAMSGVKQ